MRIRSSVVLLAVAALALSACGGDDDDGGSAAPATGLAAGSEAAPSAATPAQPAAPPALPRRVEVQMTELAFTPAAIDVKVGETVSFVFTNAGKLPHDAFIGDQAAQEEHEAEMRAMTDPNDHASHEGGITVAAAQTGALRQLFDKAGKFEIGCHQAGHYEAGMKLTINVT